MHCNDSAVKPPWLITILMTNDWKLTNSRHWILISYKCLKVTITVHYMRYLMGGGLRHDTTRLSVGHCRVVSWTAVNRLVGDSQAHSQHFSRAASDRWTTALKHNNTLLHFYVQQPVWPTVMFTYQLGKISCNIDPDSAIKSHYTLHYEVCTISVEGLSLTSQTSAYDFSNSSTWTVSTKSVICCRHNSVKSVFINNLLSWKKGAHIYSIFIQPGKPCCYTTPYNQAIFI